MFFFNFIYLLDRDHRKAEGQAEREEWKQAPCLAESPLWDSIPGTWNHNKEMMINSLKDSKLLLTGMFQALFLV